MAFERDLSHDLNYLTQRICLFVVKPDPVQNLKVTVLNSTSINVTWGRPAGLTISVEVKYQLEYMSKWNTSVSYYIYFIDKYY